MSYAKDESVSGAGVTSSGTGSRRDCIFFDDCVTEANAIINPADQLRVKAGFSGTWLTRVEPDTGWWFYIGTKYTATDLTHDLMGNPAYARLMIAVSADFDGYDCEEWWPGDEEPRKFTLPLWEGKWDEAAYRARYHQLVGNGESTKWYAGYRNMVVDPELATFRRHWFKRTVLDPEWARFKVITMYADPASSQEKTADYYAGVVLGWDPSRKSAVVLHKWKVREPLTARVDRYLEVWDHFRPVADGVEGKHELSFREAIQREAMERGLSCKVTKVNHGPDSEKIARIAALSPLIEVGRISFDGATHPEFWDEAELFPRARNDDLLDALEGAWHLMRRIIFRNRRVPRTFDVDKQFQNLARKGREPRYRVPPRKGDTYATREREARDLLWGN
jgi:predicted phage terminase large subunit-like protein